MTPLSKKCVIQLSIFKKDDWPILQKEAGKWPIQSYCEWLVLNYRLGPFHKKFLGMANLKILNFYFYSKFRRSIIVHSPSGPLESLHTEEIQFCDIKGEQ